jgi:hypothetical protein
MGAETSKYRHGNSRGVVCLERSSAVGTGTRMKVEVGACWGGVVVGVVAAAAIGTVSYRLGRSVMV